ncbi:ERV46 [Candida jiufengensis]|uniref:ERV46 n=1 Tax=Candida jiufengensis TaxID=497108 RepID=UPI0022244AA5|nr:ERV46 [Candida jiufengensis]KAI5956505.1 ERV46 [Candida jiufengensis]
MSSSRPKLISLDAFAKTVEDARIKTASGGIITLICILVALILIRNEYIDYTTIIARPELVVDRDINKQLDINLDISFLNLPCDLISIDLFDETGDLKLDVINSGLEKYRILKTGGKQSEILDDQPALKRQVPLNEVCTGLKEGEEGECGSCYGALPQDQKQYCCNSCSAVRRAYAEANWQFFDGENIEQCEKEGYVQRLKDRINENEGCRVKGSAKINRVAGTMDFAPGFSMTKNGRHVHDLSLYMKYEDKFNFDHIINHLSFGNEPNSANDYSSLSTLDGHSFLEHKKYHMNNYYLKIVSTRFETLAGKEKFDTNQYSVITHDRPLQGGKDEDHQHTVHARGGVPGVAFNFDISPLKIINREQYAKTRSGFILGVVSSIAGVLMVGALLDKSVFAAQQAIKGKKDL